VISRITSTDICVATTPTRLVTITDATSTSTTPFVYRIYGTCLPTTVNVNVDAARNGMMFILFNDTPNDLEIQGVYDATAGASAYNIYGSPSIAWSLMRRTMQMFMVYQDTAQAGSPRTLVPMYEC
jgi:hypothetical protein